ncbi:MAG: macro domain-containing protein [Anaerolineales bacterium]|nr:macro domain-containing protein [Anaerolineales bacterium]
MSRLVAHLDLPTGQRLELRQGDLTLESVDAIVNAANAGLQHGGGLAGALARRGGPIVQLQSDRWLAENGPIDHERPAVTGAGNLPCRFLIHAVGPVWGEGNEEVQLEAAVRTALETADRLGAASVALPAISTGIFGFPAERAAPVLLKQAERTLQAHADSHLREVRVVLLDSSTLQSFLTAWRQRWPLEDGSA